MHALGTAHDRTKGLTIVLLIKLLAIVAISALLWALQVKLEIGATAMVLLHLAPAAALGGGCAAERHVARATQMRVPEVPGARLQYEVEGSGPVMLLIPGATGSAYSFKRLSEHRAFNGSS